MNIIKFISLIILLCSFHGMQASASVSDPGNDTILEQLTALLKKPGIETGEGDLVAKVHFMVNRDKEIVVIHVQADNDMVASYIKERLNYQQVQGEELERGKEYIFPVRIKASI